MSHTTMQPVMIDQDGIVRFKQNRIVRQLIDKGSRAGFGIGEIKAGVAAGTFDADEHMQLIQLAGINVDSYCSCSFVSKQSAGQATAAAAQCIASQVAQFIPEPDIVVTDGGSAFGYLLNKDLAGSHYFSEDQMRTALLAQLESIKNQQD